MNHKTKKHIFKVGDLVFSDFDKKSEAMLIKVVSIEENGLYGCTYLYHNEYLRRRLGWKKKVFYNAGEFIHDAGCWGIKRDYKKKDLGVCDLGMLPDLGEAKEEATSQ